MLFFHTKSTVVSNDQFGMIGCYKELPVTVLIVVYIVLSSTTVVLCVDILFLVAKTQYFSSCLMINMKERTSYRCLHRVSVCFNRLVEVVNISGIM